MGNHASSSPLYHGERRDAFLPIMLDDDDNDDNDDSQDDNEDNQDNNIHAVNNPPSVISSSDSSYGSTTMEASSSIMSLSLSSVSSSSCTSSAVSTARQHYRGTTTTTATATATATATTVTAATTATSSTVIAAADNSRGIPGIGSTTAAAHRDNDNGIGNDDETGHPHQGGLFDCVRPSSSSASSLNNPCAISNSTISNQQYYEEYSSRRRRRRRKSGQNLLFSLDSCGSFKSLVKSSSTSATATATMNALNGVRHAKGDSFSSGTTATTTNSSNNENDNENNENMKNTSSSSSRCSLLSPPSAGTNNTTNNNNTTTNNTTNNTTTNNNSNTYTQPNDATPASDLHRPRNYHVVTTAALPWMTGTSINPLLRAGYLLRRNRELMMTMMMMQHQQQQQQQQNEEHQQYEKQQYEQQYKQQSNQNQLEDKMDTSLSSTCSSLDYSCFSFSEELLLNNNHDDDLFHHLNNNNHVSPLGTSEEECVLLFPEEGIATTDIITVDYNGGDGIMNVGVVPTRLLSKNCKHDENGITAMDGAMDGNEEQLVKEGQVTLVIPWLEDVQDRIMLYGSGDDNGNGGVPFASQKEQERYIRTWLKEEADMPLEANELNILFYPARYHKFANSIFALGDICDSIPNHPTDVCILEEPEHLNWYRAPGSPSWTTKFCHVIGVVHTNYKAYVRDHAPAGFLAASLTAGVNCLVVQANCHRVVKLSGVLQEFAPGKEVVENVHGIRNVYLKEGQRRRNRQLSLSSSSSSWCASSINSGSQGKRQRAYFIGKLLWAKGFDQLLELESYFRQSTGDYFNIDIFGTGPDELEIKRAFEGDNKDNNNGDNRMFSSLPNWSRRRQQPLPVSFLGKLDHSSLVGDDYSIFINPSVTEVLCTTTAEAIAMGKHVIIPFHPSNTFFEQFPNCLMYCNHREFVSQLQHALANEPSPLPDNLAYLLSWEAATMRCVHASAISKRDAARDEQLAREKDGQGSIKKVLSGFLLSGMKTDSASGKSCHASKESLGKENYGSIGDNHTCVLVTP